MKVMCIRSIGKDNPYLHEIEVGSIVTVLDTVKSKEGDFYYKIVEFFLSKNPPHWAAYDVNDFAPLSTLDETIIHADKKEECYV